MDGCFKEGTGRREEEGWEEERKGVGLIKEENTTDFLFVCFYKYVVLLKR